MVLYEKNGNLAGAADTLNTLGTVYEQKKSFREALVHYESAYIVYSKVNNEQGKSVVLLNLGIDLFNLGENEKAREYLSVSLPLLQKAKNNYLLFRAYNNLSYVYNALGDKANAEKYSKMARAVDKQP